MLTKYLNPRNDFAFKKLFGTEDNKDLLIRFLNAILELEGDEQINEVKFLNPDQAPRFWDGKRSIVDVLVTDQRGTYYVVEMQILHTPDFDKRVQYYAAKTYVDQLRTGEGYGKLCPVYFIAIADHVIFPEKEAYKSLHLICDRKTGSNDLNAFRFSFIELAKFKKTADEIEGLEEQWLYFLKHAEELDDVPSGLSDVTIQKAFHILDSFGWSKEDKHQYEDMMIAIFDEQGRINESYSKGKVEGIEKGRKEGREEGKRQERLEIARTMLADQFPIETIVKYTGLTQEDILGIMR